MLNRKLRMRQWIKGREAHAHQEMRITSDDSPSIKCKCSKTFGAILPKKKEIKENV